MTKPASFFDTHPHFWRSLLISLAVVQITVWFGITLIFRLAPLWGGNDVLVPLGIYLAFTSLAVLIGSWVILLVRLLRTRSWAQLAWTFFIPLVGTIIGFLLLIWQAQSYVDLYFPSHDMTWNRLVIELFAFYQGTPGLLISGFWIWIVLFLASSPQAEQASSSSFARHQAIWYGTVISIALLAVGIAILSKAYVLQGPFQGAYGNVCGSQGRDACVATVSGGGFPLPYVLDNWNFSAGGGLEYGESDFEPAFFLMDLACYSFLLWGGVTAIEQIARKRLLPSVEPTST